MLCLLHNLEEDLEVICHLRSPRKSPYLQETSWHGRENPLMVVVCLGLCHLMQCPVPPNLLLKALFNPLSKSRLIEPAMSLNQLVLHVSMCTSGEDCQVWWILLCHWCTYGRLTSHCAMKWKWNALTGVTLNAGMSLPPPHIFHGHVHVLLCCTHGVCVL